MPSLTEKVDPRTSALLVVDVQNDFCHEDGASNRNSRSTGERLQATMVPTLIQLIDEARAVGMAVIFIQTTHSPESDSEVWNERRQGRANYTCLDGSWGAEFYKVAPEPGEPVVIKHRYSAFVRTNLDELLTSMGIKSVIVTGVVTNICVESTARHAFMYDYYVVVASDCTGAPREAHDNALEYAKSFGVVASSDEITASWSSLKATAGAT